MHTTRQGRDKIDTFTEHELVTPSFSNVGLPSYILRSRAFLDRSETPP